MKKQFLNLGKALNKAEQRSISGGRLEEDGGSCSIYSVPDGQWLSGYTVEDAQWLYHNEPTVSGYCCASC